MEITQFILASIITAYIVCSPAIMLIETKFDTTLTCILFLALTAGVICMLSTTFPFVWYLLSYAGFIVASFGLAWMMVAEITFGRYLDRIESEHPRGSKKYRTVQNIATAFNVVGIIFCAVVAIHFKILG